MADRISRVSKLLATCMVFLAAVSLSACLGQAAGPGLPSVPASTPAAGAQTVTQLPPDRLVRFQQISITEGLSESVVNDTLQDRQGFIWFATQDGLNRFDGTNFKVYTHDPDDPNSLSHNNITRILEDRRGSIWIGMLNGGVDRFDPISEKFTHYLPDSKRTSTLLPGVINDLVEDKEGNIWVAVGGGGISRYNPAVDTFTRFKHDSTNTNSLVYDNVLALLTARDGALWIGTSKGLDRFDPAASTFTHFQKEEGNPNSLASSSVCRLLEDRQERLWYGTCDNGLGRYDPATGQFTHYPSNPADKNALSGSNVTAIFQERSGTLWVGTMNDGLCRLKPDEKGFDCFQHNPMDPNSLGTNIVYDVYEDRSGILWVGTFGSGVNKIDPGYKRFEHLKNDPKNPNTPGADTVFTVYKDQDGSIWAGYDTAGLDRIDRKNGQVSHYLHDPQDPDSLNNNWVRAIYKDHQGTLWIGTSGGLERFDPQTGKFTHAATSLGRISITTIAEDAQGMLWFTSSGKGLVRYDPLSEKITRYLPVMNNPNSLSDYVTTALLVDSHGAVWIGTVSYGMDRLDPATGTFTHFPNIPNDPKSLVNPTVLEIHEDSQGDLWIGTTGGLSHLTLRPDRTLGVFQNYTIKDGLPNDVIYRIEADNQGRLWMSTNRGISRFDPKTGAFKNFDAKDGLQSNEFNQGASFAAEDGEMLFGGIQGITTFYPDQIQDNPYIPPVVLTSLTGKDRPLAVDPDQPGEVTIRWPDNSFEFEFAALNFMRPEKNRYGYQLEGFDSGWNEIGSRHGGRYTNLPGGSYTLKIKGSNNDGVWNEAPTALRVHVIPPAWETWWFRSLVSVLVVASVFGGVRLRTRSIEMRNQELERMVRARTAEMERLYEQTKELAVIEERNRLARDLHDSAKQKAFAALAQLGAANKLIQANPVKTQQTLREAETLVYEVIEELTFLIQEMYPVALKEKGLASVLQEYIYEWEARNDTFVNFKIQNQRRLPIKVEQSLYRITQEALANVARHSQANQVEVCAAYTRHQVEIIIADNGQGFDLAQRPAGVGLRSMQERISMIGGTLRIETGPGKGTRVIACAPVEAEASVKAAQIETTKEQL